MTVSWLMNLVLPAACLDHCEIRGATSFPLLMSVVSVV